MTSFFKENSYTRNIFGLGLISATLFIFRKKFIIGKTCTLARDLSDCVIIITGANSGVGKEAARILAKMGPTLILACRDPNRSIPVVEEIKKDSKNSKVEFMKLDLGDLSSIKEFSSRFMEKHNKLHILINNAGISSLPERTLTKDGFEAQMGVNHIGHFYLTNLLLETIKASSPSRIINVASRKHYLSKINWDDIMSEKKYNPSAAYGQSKLANVMFTRELQKRSEGTGVKAVSLTPGFVRTGLFRYAKWGAVFLNLFYPLFYYMSRSPVEGAQEIVYCALEDYEKLKGGEFYAEFRPKKPNPEALDEEKLKRFWSISEELIKNKISE